MSYAGKLFRFFVFSNLFIAVCAWLMLYQTCELLLQQSPDLYLSCFVFFATICSYSFHWYLTPVETGNPSSRMQWHSRNRNIHFILFVGGLIAAVVCGFFLIAYWHWLALSAFITFLYSAPKIPHRWFRLLRKVALGKTIFLAFVWMYVTTLLPLLISDNIWKPAFTIFAFSRFFLIYAICIIFDYRDRDYDKKVGIRSLVTWLSEKGITNLFITSLFGWGLSTIWLLNYGQPLSSVLILLLPGPITASLYRFAKANFSDILYYFILDGLMALSALLLWLMQVINIENK